MLRREVNVQRIVVGIDGSPGSQAALAWAVDEARLRGATLEPIRVWSWPIPYVGPGMAGLDPKLLEEGEQAILDEALDAADTSGVEVEPVLVEGPAAQRLLEQAKGADLLVVGSRGRGGFKGLLLGSVSQQVVHHARGPVVVIPAEG